ncbi:MAG: hypothetical protein AAE987_07260 [Thermoplasmataceae archaeon]|jgi:predicted nucleic-acid-binding Zn-ribbon protein
MAFESLEILQRQINEEEEKLGKYCRRCSYEGKKVLMHTATVQWTDKDHIKHTTNILRVCPRCRNIRWLPEQIEMAKNGAVICMKVNSKMTMVKRKYIMVFLN